MALSRLEGLRNKICQREREREWKAAWLVNVGEREISVMVPGLLLGEWFTCLIRENSV